MLAIAADEYMQCGVCFCLCVCLLVTSVSFTQTSEPTEMLLRILTPVGQKNWGRVQIPPQEGVLLRGCPAY